MSENFEHELKVSKAILTGLGYVEKPTAPILRDRFVDVLKDKATFTENYGTMVLKETETARHMLTFGVFDYKGTPQDLVFSTFAELSDGQFKLDDPKNAKVMFLDDFNHMMLHGKPNEYMRRKPTDAAVVEETHNPILEHLMDQKIQDVLKRYPKGVSTDKYDA